ncbi:hypothetical protein [Brevundimonas sp.]|jgi:hypothetical protein|uniref:hypothetical protein n=1 Tax=Brevundimonas sp. TaxID=1871086 RepID=UPI0025C444A6|nr:hypothetical protein [Brevundimonas sp.]
MNAHFSKKTRLWALIACLAPLMGVLAACAGSFAPRTDPTSPIAPRVQALVDANRHYPSWENFPAAPTDLPAATQVAAQVGTLEDRGEALGGEVARIEWKLGDAETLAAETRAQVEAVPVSPDSLRTQAEIDAFAQGLRDRAKAPPPVDRRRVE